MRMFFSFIMSTLLVAAGAALNTPRRAATTVHLGDVAYYIPSEPLPLDLTIGKGNQLGEPCTVLSAKGRIPTRDEVDGLVAGFAQRDDVWSPDFMASVVIPLTTGDGDSPNGDASSLIHHLERQHGTQAIHLVRLNQVLMSGPYFIQGGALHEAYRLYPDFSGAFITPVVPVDSTRSRFRALDTAAYGDQHPSALTVAVPSRMYFKATPERPYAGLRFGIKDIIDAAGVKTTGGSRAYVSLYPAAEKSHAWVQQLVEQGAVLVGKLRTTQFANSEFFSCNAVDYHAPFNPIGHGYLSPSGSSHGSASAASSYSWIDFTLGTDTLGSTRSPVAAQGIFGMRTTPPRVAQDGLIEVSARFDAISPIASTAAQLNTAVRAMYNASQYDPSKSRKPKILLVPEEYFNVLTEHSAAVAEKFIQRLEKYLGVKRTTINLQDRWRDTRPPNTHVSLAQQFEHLFEYIWLPEQYRFLEKFVREYRAAHNGTAPILHAEVQSRIDVPAYGITEAQYQEGLRLVQMYEDWFYAHVMPPADASGYSEAAMLLPWTYGKPMYRDEYQRDTQRFTGQGFYFYNAAHSADCPELVFPVGSTPYVSKYSGQVEQLPAAIGVSTAKGTDVMLAGFVAELFAELEKEGERSEFVVQDL